jgi:hypothetical protein
VKLRYAAPYHIHLNGTGSNGRPGPHLFTGAASGPRNLLHRDTMSGYGLVASTVIHLQPRHATTTTTTVQMHELGGKLAIGRSFLSIFVHPDTVTRPLPLYAIKGEGGTLDKKRRDNAQQQQCTKYTLKHLNTPTHRDLGAIPLSTSLYPPTTSTSVQNNTSSSEH